MRRRRATYFDRCKRCWIRHKGKIIRFLNISDYRPCASGGDPREFYKRITHTRWPRGCHLRGSEWAGEWYAALPADKWVEAVVVYGAKS